MSEFEAKFGPKEELNQQFCEPKLDAYCQSLRQIYAVGTINVFSHTIKCKHGEPNSTERRIPGFCFVFGFSLEGVDDRDTDSFSAAAALAVTAGLFVVSAVGGVVALGVGVTDLGAGVAGLGGAEIGLVVAEADLGPGVAVLGVIFALFLEDGPGAGVIGVAGAPPSKHVIRLGSRYQHNSCCSLIKT